VLADPQHHAAEAYHVYDLLGNSVAAPAAFVVREDGQITWAYIGRTSGDLPDAQKILEHLSDQ
jgi:peroxiredoxin